MKIRTFFLNAKLNLMPFATAVLILVFVLFFLDYDLGMFQFFDIPDMDELFSPGQFWVSCLLTFTSDILLTIGTFRNQPKWIRRLHIVIGLLFSFLGTWLIFMASKDRGELELAVIPVLILGAGLLVVGIIRLLVGTIGSAIAMRWDGARP
jgi:hypothetical protein